MVVCKFFLQGTCKFGNSCRFEHQINTDNAQGTSILKQGGNTQSSTRNGTMDTNTIVQSVINDMKALEHGKQWIFSSYGPFKDKPMFPGFEDKSFEEIRLGFYEASRAGTVEQYKQMVQMWYQEALGKIKTLQNPNQDIVKLMIQIYNSVSNQQSGLQNNQGNSFVSNSVLGGNTQNTIFGGNQQNVFGQRSIFGNTSTNTPLFATNQSSNQSIFNQNNTNTQQNVNPSNSIFAQGSYPGNSIFGNNSIFNSNQNQQKFTSQTPFNPQTNQPSPFGNQPSPFVNPVNNPINNPIKTNPSPFFNNTVQNQAPINPPNSNSIFNNQTATNYVQSNPSQNVFGQPSIFGESQSVLNKNTVIANDEKPIVYYLKLEELTEEERKIFESDEFEFKKLSDRPPPLEMCF